MLKYLYLLICFATVNAHAHYIPTTKAPLSLNASLVTTWRSHDVVSDYDFWQLPGTVMGGDAWPAEKDVQIDEMKLGLGVRIDQNVYGVIEVGAHASGGEDHSSVGLEHAYLGYVCCEEKGPWVLEVGRMLAVFSPSLSVHSADRLATEAPLINDVFFGRNFHDDGARIMWHTRAFMAGVELWKGSAFPATASAGQAWDIFARYTWRNHNFTLTSGAWLYRSSAENRADHRYGGSHQHTPVAPPGAIVATFPDTRFTGDTEGFGLHADIAYISHNKQWTIGVKTEYMSMQISGLLSDAVGRAASLDAEQAGAWVQPYIRWKKHTFGFRGEWLTTDNTITGTAANQLSVDSGIYNPTGLEPSKYSATWRWQWRENIALRAEIIEDKTSAEEAIRFAIGLVWKQNWLF